MDDEQLIFDRRGFLGLAAAATAIGIGAALPVTTATAAPGPSTDFTRWLDSINGKHRVVFDMRDPNGGMAFAWTWVYYFTAPQAYGVKDTDLGAVIVLRHNGIPFALNDAAWSKYKLGEYFKINDPATKAPALRNPFHQIKPGDMPLPEAALEKLVVRGVKFGVCNTAIHHQSGRVAQQLGVPHEEVKKDWLAAVLPGVQVVPSGVLAVSGAQSKGCTYCFAG